MIMIKNLQHSPKITTYGIYHDIKGLSRGQICVLEATKINQKALRSVDSFIY